MQILNYYGLALDSAVVLNQKLSFLLQVTMFKKYKSWHTKAQ